MKISIPDKATKFIIYKCVEKVVSYRIWARFWTRRQFSPEKTDPIPVTEVPPILHSHCVNQSQVLADKVGSSIDKLNHWVVTRKKEIRRGRWRKHSPLVIKRVFDTRQFVNFLHFVICGDWFVIWLCEGIKGRVGLWLQRQRKEVVVTNVGFVQNSVTPESREYWS